MALLAFVGPFGLADTGSLYGLAGPSPMMGCVTVSNVMTMVCGQTSLMNCNLTSGITSCGWP